MKQYLTTLVVPLGEKIQVDPNETWKLQARFFDEKNNRWVLLIEISDEYSSTAEVE